MAKKVTGFELSPQGQIGSGFAQVFDTSNLVAAQVNLREQREAKFNQLIGTLAEIDPSKVHPKDTADIVYGVNQLYDFVVENYEDIANPRKDPSKLLEFNRRKSALLSGAFKSQQTITRASDLASEIPKNDYYMGAYEQNASLVERLNSVPVFTRDENGNLVDNPAASKLFGEKLKIGISANDVATKMAKDFEPQFKNDATSVQTINLKNGQVVLIKPEGVTEQQANQMIDATLSGSADGVALTNSVLGVEVPYDMLTDAEKQVVRDAVRPLFLSRIKTDPKIATLRAPSSPNDKRAFNMDNRLRTLEGFVRNSDTGVLANQTWGNESGVFTGMTTSVNNNGDVIYTVNLRDGNTQSKRDYVVGKRDEEGNIILGEDAGERYKTGLTSLISAANFSLNRAQGGDVKTPDIEDINKAFFDNIRQKATGNELDVNLGRGDTFRIGEQQLTRGAAKQQVSTELTRKEKNDETAFNRFSRFKKWAAKNGIAIERLNPVVSDKGKLTVTLDGTNIFYDLTNESDVSDFTDLLLDKVILESGVSTTERVRVGGAKPKGGRMSGF